MSSDRFLASCKGHELRKVRRLLALGANINCRDRYGESGLHIAVIRKYGKLLNLLLRQPGVDVNITDDFNQTPLMVACSAGHKKFVRRLCQVKEIDPNIKDHIFRTALFRAVSSNKPQCVEALKTVPNVDWNLPDNLGNYPLTMAVEKGYGNVLEILLSVTHLDLSVTDWRGRNVAWIAVDEEEGGDKQKMLEILCKDRRVDMRLEDKRNGDTPVMFCLKTKKIEMACCLINTPELNLDMVDSDGKYLEMIAADHDQKDVFNLLGTFTGSRLRMIQTQQPSTMFRLQSLSRDVVLTNLITNNSQERKVESLVDRMGLPELLREVLLTVSCR